MSADNRRQYKITLIQEQFLLGAALLNAFQGLTESGNPQGVLQTVYDFHAGNFVDPITWGSIFRWGPIVLNGRMSDFEYRSKITTRSIFASAAVGIAYEAYQQNLPGREFDYADCGMYVAGALTFAALSHILSKSIKSVPSIHP